MSGADTEHGIETFLNTENRLAVNVSEAVFCIRCLFLYFVYGKRHTQLIGAAIRAGFNDDRTATRCGAGLIVGRKGIGTLFAQ